MQKKRLEKGRDMNGLLQKTQCLKHQACKLKNVKGIVAPFFVAMADLHTLIIAIKGSAI